MVAGITPRISLYIGSVLGSACATADYDYRLSDSTSDPIQETPVHDARLLTKSYQKYLNECELDFLRMVNRQPSLDGVAACMRRHQFAFLPAFVSHHTAPLNRRITCWRSTRWKSLSGRIWLKKVRSPRR